MPWWLRRLRAPSGGSCPSGWPGLILCGRLHDRFSQISVRFEFAARSRTQPLYGFRIGRRGAPFRPSMYDDFVRMSVSVSDLSSASGLAYRSRRVWADAGAVRYLFEISL